eukprot:1142377-Rhodomonas_salina.1
MVLRTVRYWTGTDVGYGVTRCSKAMLGLHKYTQAMEKMEVGFSPLDFKLTVWFRNCALNTVGNFTRLGSVLTQR